MFSDDDIEARMDIYGESDEEARAALMADTFGGESDDFSSDDDSDMADF